MSLNCQYVDGNMNNISNLFGSISKETVIDIIWIIVTLVIAFVIFFAIYKLIKMVLLRKAKTKKQVSNVMMFLKIVKYLFAFIFILVFISSYFGSWAEFSLVAGLLTVALGFALQRPLTSIVAWIILVIRRPFHIGDRIIVGNVKGDVKDITITYMSLEEIGGTIEGEEKSGRIILVPNSTIFEKEIINYTAQHDFIVDEVKTAITYESNLKKAEEIIIKAIEHIMKPFWDSFPKKVPKKIPKEPHIRLQFRESGIDVTVRYHVLAIKRNEISTNITREIFNRIKKAKDVEIAYPHAEVLFRKK